MSDASEQIEPGISDLTNLTPARIPDAAPPETYKELGGDYPVALVIGGLAIGLIAGALLPRSVGRRIARGAVAMAAVAGELGSTYGRKVIDGAAEVSRDGREKLGELSGNAGDYGRAATTAASASARRGRDLAITIVQEAIKIAAKLRR
ncbi:MAG: hypothetical protein ABIW31_02580 [Novosphingobium sp.]